MSLNVKRKVLALYRPASWLSGLHTGNIKSGLRERDSCIRDCGQSGWHYSSSTTKGICCYYQQQTYLIWGESLLEQHKHKSIPGWPLLRSHSPLPWDDQNTPTARLNQNLIFSSLLLSISATKRHSCKVSGVTYLQPTANNPAATTLSAGQLWLKL